MAPAFGRIARNYPEVTLEVAVEDGFVDIVARRFDAGIRLGDSVGREMIAVPITRELRTAIVASPAYFAEHPPPRTPRELLGHRCIGYRQIASGALYRWEFDQNGEKLDVAVTGPLVLDDAELMICAALDGDGLAYATENMVSDHLAAGRLVRVLEDWCSPYAGFHVYYPSRRQLSAAVRAVIQELRV